MSGVPDSVFKPPPIVECIVQGHCLGFGRKIHCPDKVCNSCLKRHDFQQLRSWARNNATALELVEAEVLRKQELKQNIEAHGRYLCAFEDPDYQYCRWRQCDLNLRGTRLNCGSVRRKGRACSRCWRRRLRKIGIVQYFTPTGLCHEESDKIVTAPETAAEEESEDEDDDDVEGYNLVLDGHPTTRPSR
jgi:hypothetical protein